MLTATDFQADEPYKKNTELVTGRFPGPDDEYGLLVTTVLAAKYKLKTGDSITLFIPSVFGARNAMDFIITGIVRASAPWYEDGITIRVQDYLSMSELGDASPFYKAYVKDERGIPAMVKELSARMNSAEYRTAMNGAEYRTAAEDFPVKGYRDDKFVRFLLNLGTRNVLMFGFMAMIIFLALLIGIRSIILTNIFDRRDEIGTLRALGFPRGTVRMLFFGEALAALFVGYLLGSGAVAVIGAIFEAWIVRPPLLMLQYMFGMTRMGITLNAFTLLVPLALLFLLLFATTFRTVGRETEQQAAAQMANR
jgi:ABC-type lipoprotein release transport system permease subunit